MKSIIKTEDEYDMDDDEYDQRHEQYGKYARNEADILKHNRQNDEAFRVKS